MKIQDEDQKSETQYSRVEMQICEGLWLTNAIFRFPRVLPSAHHLESHEETFPVQLEDSDQWRVGRWSPESSTHWWVRRIGLINGGSFWLRLAAKTQKFRSYLRRNAQDFRFMNPQTIAWNLCLWVVSGWEIECECNIFLRTLYLPQSPWPSI